MRIRKIIFVVAVTALAAIVAACAGSSAPYGWSPPAREAQREAFGAWIEITFAKSAERVNIEGEFIAVDGDKIVVLTEETIISAPIVQIEQAKLMTYGSRNSLLAVWTLVGTLSTLSHGIGLIFSAPAWIIVGTVATSSESYAPRATYPHKSWEELRKFARFPQGLPLDLEHHPLKGK
jgi:hypothetical protein